MSPVYHHTVIDCNVNPIGHIRARNEALTTLGYLDAIDKVDSLLPDICYRTLVEQLQAAIYMNILDESEPALYMSPQVEGMLGYAPEEWLVDPDLWIKLLHPEDRKRALTKAERSRSTGEPFKMEYRLIARDEHVVWVRDEAVQVKTPEVGCSAGWQGIMLDVTEQKLVEKELKASEKLFRNTFEAAGVGIAHVTLDGRWLRVNDKLCEISGYNREELLGTTFLELTPPEDQQASLDRIRRMLAGKLGPYSVEKRYVRKDGARIWVNLSVSLAYKSSGEPDFLVCVADDITERKIEELVPESFLPREMEILDRIVAERRNRQIAEDLSLSMGTVKRDVRRILYKLGVGDRRRAAARALEIGLVSPSPRYSLIGTQ